MYGIYLFKHLDCVQSEQGDVWHLHYVYMLKKANPKLRGALHLMMFLALVQVALGIVTLLSRVQIHPAAMHQAVAMLLLVSTINCAVRIKYKS